MMNPESREPGGNLPETEQTEPTEELEEESVLEVDKRIADLQEEAAQIKENLLEHIQQKKSAEGKEDEEATPAEKLLHKIDMWFALRFRPSDYGDTAEKLVAELTGRKTKVLAWRHLRDYPANQELIGALDEVEERGLSDYLECHRDINEEEFFEKAPYDPMCVTERIYRRHVYLDNFDHEIKRAKNIARWKAENSERLKDIPETRRRSFAICMDINGLKQVNDKTPGGHMEGDKFIRHAAKMFRKYFKRESDIIGRLGGDEFAVIARSSSLEKIMANLQKMIEEMSDYTVELVHEDGSKETVTLEVAIGISEIVPEDTDKTEKSWQCAHFRADDASYLAKKLGKRRQRETEPYTGMAVGSRDENNRDNNRRYIPFSEITASK